MPDTTSWGARLLRWRTARGISQAQLAAYLEIPANTISRWERGSIAIQQPGLLRRALQAYDLEQKAPKGL